MITRKKYIINEPRTIYSFITSDGYEFESEREAKRHEAQITPQREIKQEYIYLESESKNKIIYLLNSEEDIMYLKTIHYDQNWSYTYEGPGWYILDLENGGDYKDMCYLQKVSSYAKVLSETLAQLQEFIT